MFPTPEQRVANFCSGRSAQPDDRFVADCNLPPEPEAVRVALAVRRAVANIGSVSPEFIRADDVYPDQLGALPLWDSMDWLAFTLEVEAQLGLRLRDEEMILVANRVSVKQMVADIRRMIANRSTA